MKVDWIKGLSPNDAEKIQETLKYNQKLLDRLKDIIYNYYRASESLTNDYDTPSWPLKAAHQNGERMAYKKLLALLDLDNA